MSIVQMEEHFVIVVRDDNVAKLRFHLASVVEGHQIPWIPHISPNFHRKNIRTIYLMKGIVYNNIVSLHLEG
jgi:hypothetical protein